MSDLERRTYRENTETWNEVRMVAAMRSAAEDRRVSMNDIVRRGVRREIEAADSPGEYEPPPGFEPPSEDGEAEDE